MSYKHSSLSIPLFFTNQRTSDCDYFKIGAVNEFETAFKVGSESRQKRDFILSTVNHSAACKLLAEELRDRFLKNPSESFGGLSLNFLSKYGETGFQLYLHLSKMCMALHLFKDIKKRSKPLDEIWRYLYHTLRDGPLYAKYLKDVRELTFIRNVATEFHASFKEDVEKLQGMDMFPSIDDTKEADYDDILKESYLIHFKEDVNDFPWAFQKPEEDSSAIDIFIEGAKELFGLNPIQLDELTSEDYSRWVSDSSTFSELTGKNEINRKLIREIMSRGENPYSLDDSPFSFKRTKIQVSPANTRDAWSCSLPTLIKIKTLSFKLRQICASLEFSAMGCSPQVALRRKKFLRQENSLYIMLDYRKCGLTVNRRLLSIIGDVLFEQYGDKDFLLIKRFEDCEVTDVEKVQTFRGTGLGNCNEGITLLQCVIGHLLKKMFGCNSIFFNDDGVIQIPKHLVKRNLVRIITLIRNFGMVINLKKTFLSHSNVFCEDYTINAGDFKYQKRQLLILPFCSAFLQKTIYQAKRLFYSLDRGTKGHRVNTDGILSSIVKFYGYEFFESEYSIPYHIGGWKEYSSSNYSLLLDWLYYPQKYAKDSISRSQIGLAQSWAYDILISLERTDLLSNKSRITYRKKVKSVLQRPFEIDLYSDLSSRIYKLSGFSSKEELDTQFDDMLNVRGLHNAKPVILNALALKEERRRKLLFKNRSNTPIRFALDTSSLSNLLALIKKLPDAPENFAAPLPPKMVKEVEFGKGHVRIVTRKGAQELDRSSLNSTLASIEGKRLFKNSLVDLHLRILSRKNSGYLISDNPIISPGNITLPNWMRLLYPSKRLARLEIATRLGGNILEPIKLGLDDNWEKEFKSPLVMIFGAEALEIESILRKGKFRKDVVDFYRSIEINDIEQFRKSVHIVRLLILDKQKEVKPELEEEPAYRLHQFLEELDDKNLYKDFFGTEYEHDDLEDQNVDRYDEDGLRIIPEWEIEREDTFSVPDEEVEEYRSPTPEFASDDESIDGDELRRLNRDEFRNQDD